MHRPEEDWTRSLLRALSLAPERLTDVAAWHRHIPLAFTLMALLRPQRFVELGTHRGDSYCAFCQGAAAFDTGTRCFAVDSWSGDEHAGRYGPEILAELRAHHDARYGEFSQLMQMRFDDALAHFEDGSVELLHIDGLHTYEAVRHDFLSWKPKLGSGAVVLFHDTAVETAGFGVGRLWRELCAEHEGFEFRHGYGLGLLLVGTEHPPAFRSLLGLLRQDFALAERLFYRIGGEIELAACEGVLAATRDHRDRLGADLAEAREVVARRDAELQSIGAQLTHARSVVEMRDASLAAAGEEVASTGEALTLAQEALSHARDLAARTGAELDASRQALAASERDAGRLRAQLAATRHALDETDAKLRLIGRSRVWRARSRVASLLRSEDPMSAARLRHAPPRALRGRDEPVDVIIPVYRGLAETRACIESVLASSYRTPAEIVVIDDASPEPELTAYLRGLGDAVTLLENERNLGFVATVNRGMALHPGRDVLLLNSDTVVANDWLDRLRECAWRDVATASVTPFSNNATICSYPRFCQDNALPQGMAVAELDALFRDVNRGEAVPIPTAVGFCMYIRRDCLEQVGLFDADLFGRGYGEENEFCMRAARHGWRHLLCADTYVYHAGGVSFADTQSEQQKSALRTLTALYPGYEALIAGFVCADPPAPCRFAAELEVLRRTASRDARPAVLMINHARGGGTERHLRELAATIAEQATVLFLRPHGAENQAGLLSLHGSDNALPFDPVDDYALLVELLRALGVRRVHFHHTIGVHTQFWRLPQDLGVPYDFTVHDYYLACPQVTMTTPEGAYCGEPDDVGCRRCLQQSPAPGVSEIGQWRSASDAMVRGAARVFVPGRDAERRMQRYFPGVATVFAPHENDRLLQVAPARARPLADEESLRIVVLGAVAVFKGANLLEDCARAARRRRLPLEYHLLGYAYRPLASWPATALREHGAYREEELARLLRELAPHLVWFPGSCPETYSYTLSACVALGLPVVAPAIGAYSERLAGREWSWLIAPDPTPAAMSEFFVGLRRNFLHGAAPEPVRGVPAAAGFDYRRDYVAAGPQAPAARPADWTRYHRYYARRQVQLRLSGAAPGRSAGALFFAGLQRLKRHRLLSRLESRVPLVWKIRLKNWLQQTDG